MRSDIMLGQCFWILGAFLLQLSSSSKNSGHHYLVNPDTKLYESKNGQLIEYEIHSSDRVKRQVEDHGIQLGGSVPEETQVPDKKKNSINKKVGPSGSKILIDPLVTNPMGNSSQTLVGVSPKSMTNMSNPNVSLPPVGASLPPSSSSSSSNSTLFLTNTTTILRVTTTKPIVVDVVLVNSTEVKSFPGSSVTSSDRSPSSVITTNSNIPTATLTPPEPFPEFPPLLPQNITRKNDTHRYYNTSYFQNGEFLWIDLDNHPDMETHELLSNAYRRAATIRLEFQFPFYGHIIENVTMATGGFCYLGEHVHAWLAATQYIAPLMANFDSRMANVSAVRYVSNAAQFTVEWNQVHLHNSTDMRPFTFQTSLYPNGTIVFAYKEVPNDVKDLNDTHHPVKVGLSDAYITDKQILFVKSRTIFEYDRVDLRDYKITSGSGIIFTALPTCLSYKSCHECTTHQDNFLCVWCPKAKRCSDGTDRHRQDWLIKSCTFQSLDRPVSCLIGTTTTENIDTYKNIGHIDEDSHHHDDTNHLLSPEQEQYNHDHPHQVYPPEKVTHEMASKTPTSGMSASGIVGLLFFLILIFGAFGWIGYAYYHPHSASGQLLIRFRPSQWSAFRRGEARYTAASIHM